ncbi:hypothetical protein VB776_16340 [Arcicella sp. DC2W]|uniref:Uncharacterized protein n=1 Tax=Arcicella gelida TaxID=2984195 RepID=A0ABU5S7Q3_9BACT|nr:hypothetical protein [Arcicella sp. DC2W]MEA5404503.1 hypothetical protein [Arcicella sp. DC2W]
MNTGDKIYSTGNDVNIREKPSLNAKVLFKKNFGDEIGIATGKKVIAERYPNDGTPIEWIEIESDPFFYPPVRYVASLYASTGEPEETQTANIQTDETTDPLETKSDDSSKIIIMSGLLVSVVSLVILAFRKS